VIGSRENVVYRQTAARTTDVNGLWMCDYGRLNIHSLNSPGRLTKPLVRGDKGLEPVSWKQAIRQSRLGTQGVWPARGTAVIASGPHDE